jgi:hypothetical protein
VGDLTDEPIAVPLKELEEARAIIRKQKNRLLALAQGAVPTAPDPAKLIRAGLKRCHDGLTNPTIPGMKGNAKLSALKTWAERLVSSKDPQGWEKIFRPGKNLWRGLHWIHDSIEHYGTGGGLARPIFAEFLNEAAITVKWPELQALAGQYEELGRAWSVLADAALPENVGLFRREQELRLKRTELRNSGAPIEEILAVSKQIASLGEEASASFPLSESEARKLREELAERVLSLYEGEVRALESVREMAK